MGSSAVLLFTVAALLLVLAELGQSAPAQDQLSGPQREALQNYYQQLYQAQGQSAPVQEHQSSNEASDGGYNQWREAVEKYYKQIAEAQAYYSPEQLVQTQNQYRGAQDQGAVCCILHYCVCIGLGSDLLSL